MFRLPVSGLPVVFQQPTGYEDLLLQEYQASDTAVSLALIRRLVRTADETPVIWTDLTMTDLEALLLQLRKNLLGDVIRAVARCTSEGCGAPIDVSFGIAAYLESRKIRTPDWLEMDDAPGWFRLRDRKPRGEAIRFRLPKAGDLTEIERENNPDRLLMERCLEPSNAPARLRQRAERAMESMAPLMSQMVAGECPECHRVMQFFFNVRSFVLQELRRLSATIYYDVHQLALHYKWLEDQILAVPSVRRVRYIELIHESGATA